MEIDIQPSRVSISSIAPKSMNYRSIEYRVSALADRISPSLSAFVRPRIEIRCLSRASLQAQRLRQELATRPVLILGSGPALNLPTGDDFAAISRRFFVIGVNRTFYRCCLDLFLSSYPLEHCLALLHKGGIRHRVQMRPTSAIPIVRGSTVWKRIVLGSREVDEELGTGAPPVVRTKLNVALGATDLAVRLGGRDIYFLGVEQNSLAHYFDHDESVKSQIRSDVMRFIGDDAPFSADHPYATVTRVLDRLNLPAEELDRTPFYEVDHADTFALLFADLSRFGASFTSIGEDTVVSRSGARVASLADVLKG